MLLSDCRLVTDKGSYYDTDWYYSGIPVPIEFVGVILLPINFHVEEDRRIQTVLNLRGQRAIVYMSSDGFKMIKLCKEK